MYTEKVLYVEVDGKAYWQILDSALFDVQVVPVFDYAGTEVGVFVYTDIDKVVKSLRDNLYIDENMAVKGKYEVVAIMNGSILFSRYGK